MTPVDIRSVGPVVVLTIDRCATAISKEWARSIWRQRDTDVEPALAHFAEQPQVAGFTANSKFRNLEFEKLRDWLRQENNGDVVCDTGHTGP